MTRLIVGAGLAAALLLTAPSFAQDKADKASQKFLTEAKDIREYEQEAKKNDAAGNYAKEALPTLRKHLEAAESLTGGAYDRQALKFKRTSSGADVEAGQEFAQPFCSTRAMAMRHPAMDQHRTTVIERSPPPFQGTL